MIYGIEVIGEICFEVFDNKICVIWSSYGDVGFNIIDCYKLFIFDDKLGCDFDVGLENIKVFVENNFIVL